MSRYARQISLPEIGPDGQARLKAAHVLVVGAGGLGATVLPLLAGAGVGQITLVDPDRIEESNLHRQILYRMEDLGRAKAVVAAESLARLNPDCRISGRVERAHPANVADLAEGVDLLIDAADNFAVSYALSDFCFAMGLPLITASVLGRSGYAAGLCGGGPSLRALFPDLPGIAQTCATGGVMGPAVATLGAIQVQMALSVLLEQAPSPLGQILQCDLAAWRLSGFRFDGASEQEGPAILAPSQIKNDDQLFDLRQSEAPTKIGHDRRAIFVCTTGLRAWRAARAAMDDGHQNVAVVGDGT